MSPQAGDAQTWQVQFTLPADAGLNESETFYFIYQGSDDLDNLNDRILTDNIFQVYQSDLPPLEPQNLARACHEAGIITTLPRPETSGNRKKGMYVKADFAYDADADVYRCPAGETLKRHYTTEEQGLVVHRYWTNLCQTCEIKARCTTGKERRITPLSSLQAATAGQRMGT